MAAAPSRSSSHGESITGWSLVTFGAGLPNWRAAARRLGRQAEGAGVFSSVEVFTDVTLRQRYPEFAERHQRVLSLRTRGFGYWIWKPFLIREVLRLNPRARGVIYLDAGCQLNFFSERAVARFGQYADMALDGPGLFAMHLPGHKEVSWTKQEALVELGLDGSAWETDQVQATPMFAQNRWSRDFVDEWLRNCVDANYRLVRDPLPSDDQAPQFVAHRHDQSVFSVMVKQSGIHTIPDETFWAPDWPRAGADYPIWAARNRTRVDIRDARPLSQAVRFGEKVYSRLAWRMQRPPQGI